MKVFLYELSFPGGVHFGRHGIGLEESSEVLGSDSLVSALINASSILGMADHLLGALTENPPAVVFSSLFPFGPVYKDGRTRRAYALPRPLELPALVPGSTDFMKRHGKDIKKLRYIEPQDLVRWLDEDQPMTQDELKSLAEKASRLGKAYDARTGMGWFARDLRPRVSIDRSSSGSSIWHCGIIRFVPGAGLYGLVAVRDESYLENLKAAFRILGEMGLGGERTYGLGEFEFSGFKLIEKTWPDVVNAFSKSAARRYVLLSRYFPSEGELETLKESLVAWDFEESRGYITSGRQGTTVKRKRLYLIKEGSVSRKPLKGRLVDVTPEAALELGVTHSVFRCGLGLWFPL